MPGIFGVLRSELARARVALKLYLVTVDIVENKFAYWMLWLRLCFMFEERSLCLDVADIGPVYWSGDAGVGESLKKKQRVNEVKNMWRQLVDKSLVA